jgi:Flp pilus assembly protein TadB
MKNGVDAHALAVRIKTADPASRRRLIAAYRAWILQGAKAGQAWTLPGILAIVLAVAAALLGPVRGLAPTIVYAACAVLVLVGLLLFRVGARKERAWRETNPFRD